MDLYERSDAALKDWEEIVEYSLDHHGLQHTEIYLEGLTQCMEALAQDRGYYKEIKVKSHMVKVKHCQKHYIFGLVRKNRPLMIIALLHERMDMIARLANRLK